MKIILPETYFRSFRQGILSTVNMVYHVPVLMVKSAQLYNKSPQYLPLKLMLVVQQLKYQEFTSINTELGDYVTSEFPQMVIHPSGYPGSLLLNFSGQLQHATNVTNRASLLGEIQVSMQLLLLLSDSTRDGIWHLLAIKKYALYSEIHSQI